MSQSPQIVVVGCPSQDRVAVGGALRDVVGGAGFLTALAARAAGATVGLVARVPPDLPASVARVFGPGGIDRAGLRTAPGRLPSFHIVYDDAHAATYVQAEAGLEADLTAADVPDAWLRATLVHVASLGGSTQAQLRFVRDLRARGFRGLLSAGTWSGAVRHELDAVGELLLETDFFFLNRAEAASVLPRGVPPRHRGVVCVTEGADGVAVHGGDVTRFRPPAPARVVDPTGAGDSFCGGFLGATVRGLDGPAAGLAIAGHSLSDWGGEATAALVADGVRPRVRVDAAAVARVGAALAPVASASAFDFAAPPFPPVGAPRAATILALATMHQFGFWTVEDGRWAGPMDAALDGEVRRGSEFVWHAFARADPALLDPARMAEDPENIDRICAADDGRCPLPDLAAHRRLHQAHGRALLERGAGGWPGILEEVRAAPDPSSRLLEILATLPGYAEDPLAKKARLLALVLGARPERFLGASPSVPGAIVDYHLMRGCLRTGLVEVLDAELRARLEARREVDVVEEGRIRAACAEALDALEAASGCTVGEIDGFFFAGGRSVCLQQEPPRCDACGLQGACARRTDLFQPVFRTTAY